MEKNERRGVRDPLPSLGLVSSPGGQAVSPESLVLRAISSNSEDCSGIIEQVIVYPGRMKITRDWHTEEELKRNPWLGHRRYKKFPVSFLDRYDNEMKEKFRKCRLIAKETTKRGPIRQFSRKSRRNLLYFLSSLEEKFAYWGDFTFADDIMEGLSITERARLSSKIWNRFVKELNRLGYKIKYLAKREWKHRKHGRLIGKLVPHFHVLFNIEGGLAYIHYRWEYEAGRVFDNIGWFALSAIWVKITGTEERFKALSVAHHSNRGKLSSFREVTSRKQAGHYFSAPKYFTKEDDEEVPEGESIGRCWFSGGSPERSEGVHFDFNADEMVLLRRYLRRYTERRSRFWSRLIAKKHNRISVFMDRETAYNLLLWIRYELGSRRIEGIPF